MRSDAVRKGMQQAPHRSLFNALGMTEEEMNKPLVGIVSSYNEIVPGHMNLDKIVEAVKLGVAMGGGAPAVKPAAAPAVTGPDLSDDAELVAVMTAAIAAYEGSATSNGLVVRSIRRVGLGR